MSNNRELSQLSSIITVDDSSRNIGIATTATPYVGIGTTNPQYKLDVYGDIGVSSDVSIGGNLSISGITTSSEFKTGTSGQAIGINTNTISGPETITIDPAAIGDNTGLVIIKGDLQVDGTETVINSTTVTVNDKNIQIADGAINDAAADGAGFTVNSGGGNKTFQFVDANDSFQANISLDVTSGNVYKINGTEVLSATTLGSSVVNSSLTSVGTLGQLNVTGVVTASSFDGDLTGNADTATYATNAGIATYASTAGIATYTSEWTLGANGTSDFTFTGPGLTGAENDPTLYLVRGQQYKFTSSLGATHPFRIQSTPNGSTGTQYNDGITNNDLQNGTLTWDVQFDSPDVLYYQCTSHGSMGGKIYILNQNSNYSTNAGVATYASTSGISTNVIGGIASVTQLSVSGISTLGVVTAGNVYSTGIVTATSFSGSGVNLTGIVTQIVAGTNVSISPVGGTGVVTINATGGGGGGSGIQILDEGSVIGSAITAINFVGSGITASSSGTISTITVSSSGGAQVSVGTEAPSNPNEGDLWYSSLLARTFVYYNDGDSSQWVDSSPFNTDRSEIVKEEFTVSGTRSTFTLSNTYANGYIDVYLNGSKLSSTDFVEVNSNTITLVETAVDGDVVEFVNYKAVSVDLGYSKIIKDVFSLTSSQSVFTLSDTYTSGYIDVYLNGVKLSSLDYSETTSSTITLSPAATSGDVVEIVNYKAIYTLATESSGASAVAVSDWRDTSLF